MVGPVARYSREWRGTGAVTYLLSRVRARFCNHARTASGFSRCTVAAVSRSFAPTRTASPPRSLAAASMLSSVKSSPTATGHRPANGGPSMKRANARPLSAPAGRTSKISLAWLKMEFVVARDQRAKRRLDLRAERRIGAKMHRDCGALVLDEQRRVAPREISHAAADKSHVLARQPDHASIRKPHLGAMDAGGRQARRRDQAIDRSDRTAGNQRHRAAGPDGEPRQHGGKARGDDDAIGRRRDVDERAVDIEEERAFAGRRGHCGKCRGRNHGSIRNRADAA